MAFNIKTTLTTLAIIFCVSMAIAITSCSTCKKSTETKKGKSNVPQLKASFELSGYASSFIDDVNEEMRKNNTPIGHYKPSMAVVKKYALLETEDGYKVQGTISPNKNFKVDYLKDCNISFNIITGELITVTIPIDALGRFLLISSVRYFEMNPPGRLRN